MRRQAILDATEALVVEKGFEAVRMEEIAQAADLSKGTLYLYFKNKGEIAVALHNRSFRLVHNSLAEVIAGSGTGLEILKKMSRLFLQFAQANPHHFKSVVYIESIGIHVLKQLSDTETMSEARQLDENLFNYVKRAIQIGMQDGSIDRQFNPDKITIQILSAIRGLMQHIVFKEQGMLMSPVEDMPGITLEVLIEDYFTLLIRSLTPQK